MSRQRLARRDAAQKNISNEEIALKELKTRLAKKNLTPEAFFRVCDADYTKAIPCSIFKQHVQNFGLQLSRGQVSRLILILDEDVGGVITLDEYQHALEAYGQGVEKHIAMDGGHYTPFDHKAMFKLLAILKERNISVDII